MTQVLLNRNARYICMTLGISPWIRSGLTSWHLLLLLLLLLLPLLCSPRWSQTPAPGGTSPQRGLNLAHLVCHVLDWSVKLWDKIIKKKQKISKRKKQISSWDHELRSGDQNFFFGSGVMVQRPNFLLLEPCIKSLVFWTQNKW